jgi:hypothetical protein
VMAVPEGTPFVMCTEISGIIPAEFKCIRITRIIVTATIEHFLSTC